jgi:hypothetical protein
MSNADPLARPTSSLPARLATRTGAFAVLALGILGLAGCEAQCFVSAAKLSEESMASAVNAETKAPTAAATTFAPDAPVIYATAKLSGAPDGTKIKATFHYLEGGERQIALDEVQAGGSRYVFFTLMPPINGWPPGQYETRFYLDGKPGKRLPFNILPAPPPRHPTPARTPGAWRAPSATPNSPSTMASTTTSSATQPWL